MEWPKHTALQFLPAFRSRVFQRWSEEAGAKYRMAYASLHLERTSSYNDSTMRLLVVMLGVLVGTGSASALSVSGLH